MPRVKRRFPNKPIQDNWDKNYQCYLCGTKLILTPVTGKRNICQTCYLKRSASSALGDTSKWPLLLNKLNKQNWKCAYTGIPLILRENASVEHILPVSRYPKYKGNINNIEWVDLNINQMKGTLTKQEFLAMCQLILERSQS